MKLIRLLLVLFLFQSFAFATNYFVAKTGSDSNNGLTAGTAKLTITAAFTLAGTGVGQGANDVIEVAAGTYAESFINNLPSGTSWAAPFTLQAKSGDTVTIKANTGAQHNFAVYDTRSMFAIIQGFILDGTNLSNDQIRMGGGGTSPSDIKLIGNQIINTAIGNAMYVGEFSSNIQILNNIVRDGTFFTDSNGQGVNHALYLTGNNCLIEGNEFYNIPAYGVHQYSQHTPPPSNNIVRNNKIHNFSTGTCCAAGILLSSGTGSQAYNNVVYNGAGSGISISNGKVYNNTIYGNGYIGLDLSSSSIIARNNIIYGNSQNVPTTSGATTSNNFCNAVGTGCQFAGNPAFVSTSTPDFHLTAGSPAIGKGCTTCGTELTSLFTTDYEGNDRQASIPWDAGAYEYGVAAGPSLTIGTPTGGESWTIGQPQTVTWTCVGCGGGGVDILEDQDGNGSYETRIGSDNTANDNIESFTLTGTANANRRIQICDSDGSPCGLSGVYAAVASSGGGLTKRISANTTGTKTGDITGTNDTWLYLLTPTVNNGNDQTVQVNKYDAGGHRHQLIKFDLTQIPTTSTVTSVNLGFYVTAANSATAHQWDIRKMLRNWVEGEATWNLYSTGNSWTTAGGLGAATDRVATASASISSITTAGQFYNVTDSSGTLKTDVQGWVTTPATNFGWHLERNGTGNDNGYKDSVSREGTNGQRPFLEVTYTTTASTITVTEPKSGDLFLSGQQGPVRFTSQGISGTVKIDLSRDGGTTWEPALDSSGSPITSVAYNASDVTVTYNAPTSSNCKIRVVSNDGSNTTGTSSGTFRIGGTRAGFTIAP